MLLIFVGMQRLFIPNVPPQAAQKAVEKAAEEERKDLEAGDVDSKKIDGDPKKPDVIPPPDPKQALEKVITLGSMDPAKGYRLLVTATTRGGGIERIELVDEKKADRFRYQALEHRGGYLGYLGWRPTSGGVLVTTVPVDSPAFLATSTQTSGPILVGDVLSSIDNTDVHSYDAVQRVLKDIKPGKEVELAITRLIDGKAQQLTFKATLSQPPLDVLRTHENLAEQVPGNLQRLSCLTTLASVNSAEIPIGMRSMKGLENTLRDHWEMLPLEVAGGQGVEFRLPLADALKVTGVDADLVLVKRYRLYPVAADAKDKATADADAYSLDFETTVENRSGQAVDVSLRHEALAGVTLEGWWYSVKVSEHFFKGAGVRDVRFRTAQGFDRIVMARDIFTRELKNPKDQGLFVDSGQDLAARTLEHVGLDAQYFAAAVLPHPDAPDGLTDLKQAGTKIVANPTKIVSSQVQAVNTAVWFDTATKSIQPGASMSTRYRIFAGPKDQNMLAHYKLDDFLYYGWIPWVAKPLGWILHFFYAIVRNYGLAIIMLTVLVRACMFPIGRAAAINGQKMSEMQPEMKRINEEFKEDMQKRAAAMQELYKKHNFKPLSGCLPAFIQLPILTGLYRCLSVDISLRQEALIPGLSWCSNLAGPDMLLDWSSWMPEIIGGRGTGYLGPYFNILPVITIILFLVQQKVLMPKSDDEQMKMTQNMMQIMTVVMGVMFFKVPSGLCIYFITSSIWSLAERQLVKRLLPPRPASSTTVTAPPPKPAPKSNNGNTRDSGRKSSDNKDAKAKPSRWSEIRELLEKPAVKSRTHRKDDKKKR